MRIHNTYYLSASLGILICMDLRFISSACFTIFSLNLSFVPSAVTRPSKIINSNRSFNHIFPPEKNTILLHTGSSYRVWSSSYRVRRSSYRVRRSSFGAVLWIRNDFFSEPIPDPDPTFQRVPDPIPDPDQTFQSSGSDPGSGSCMNLYESAYLYMHRYTHTHTYTRINTTVYM